MRDEEERSRQWAPDRAEIGAMTDRVAVNEAIYVAADRQIALEALLQWRTDLSPEKRNGMIGALIRWRIAAKDFGSSGDPQFPWPSTNG